MKYKLKTILSFEKELKALAKKYISLRNDYALLLDLLEVNPNTGSPLGKDCYKIRFAIKSKRKGKSGGARVIICVKIIEKTVYLLSIYDKSDMDNITEKNLIERLKEINLT